VLLELTLLLSRLIAGSIGLHDLLRMILPNHLLPNLLTLGFVPHRILHPHGGFNDLDIQLSTMNCTERLTFGQGGIL
jgi:hypothetical protein